jgi:phosphoribosyl-ATP pyrophosphohydrolase/phosphoribosyl-AMP cyclohydrolase
MNKLDQIDFAKGDGLVPAIIQDINTLQVLMLGYMNEEALVNTRSEGKVCFFSRTMGRLWTKGEESGNFLNVCSIELDCDQDALLIRVNPVGPTCHNGTKTCWGEGETTSYGIISELENTIRERWDSESTDSYVAALKANGTHKIAQKVGEEAVEVVIEALRNDDHLFLEESADLLFHYLLLLKAKGYQLDDVLKVLIARRK